MRWLDGVGVNKGFQIGECYAIEWIDNGLETPEIERRKNCHICIVSDWFKRDFV